MARASFPHPLALVCTAFAAFVYGVMRLGWDFDQMAAMFFAMARLSGIIGGLGVNGTARSFVNGLSSMPSPRGSSALPARSSSS
jgi:uncharacterized ion transporter superfamily protein YfcC